MRLGSTNRVAGSELLAELKRSLSHLSFDQMPCPEVGREDLDKALLKWAFSHFGHRINRSYLQTLGILVPCSAKLVCSYGGIILFGKKQLREKYFPNATVRCARFRGTERVDFLDQHDVSGSIVDAM